MTLIFSFISHTPTDPCISHTCYPPISLVPLHVPYFLKLPRCLCISSTLLGAACLSPIWGIGRRFLFEAPELSSGLSLEQMVGFSLVHSSLEFLCCESWVKLIPLYYMSIATVWDVHVVYIQ